MRTPGHINPVLFLLVLLMITLSCCEKYWDDYYQAPGTTGVKLMEAIRDNPDYSEFVKYLESTGLDTLLNRAESFTLFIPNNNAFYDFGGTDEMINNLLGYHIARTVFIPSNINGSRKLETLTEKYVLLTEDNDGIYMDGVPVSRNSPLYKDGIFYELDQVVYPRPNLYEYLDEYNPLLTIYIDSRDSISLDYTESTPIDFDRDGNTIYDSVYEIINRFERDFFPVSVESRDEAATILFPTEEMYNEALDLMADNLGGTFSDHKDIPVDWQNEFLMPWLFENGVFEGSLEYNVFMNDSVENIRGEMMPMDYSTIDQGSRALCSNGITYQYSTFTIPEESYLEEIIYEGEDLTINVSGGYFTWDEELISSSDNTIIPNVFDSPSASDGKYVSIDLPRGSNESYSIELKLAKIFPRKYKLVWRGNYKPSGVVVIYVNDEYIGNFDSYNFRYPVQGINPDNGFNRVEFDVNNITSYSDVTVKLEYTSPGIGTLNGINIDYISLTPAD